MPADLIADLDVSDPARYEAYKRLAPPAIEKYGGRYLAHGGRTEELEGTWSPKRFVIVQFESVERIRAFFDSPEYRAARKARAGAGVFRMIATEGLSAASSGAWIRPPGGETIPASPAGPGREGKRNA